MNVNDKPYKIKVETLDGKNVKEVEIENCGTIIKVLKELLVVACESFDNYRGRIDIYRRSDLEW